MTHPATTNHPDGYACGFCWHEVKIHNLDKGCPVEICRCMATPGEANRSESLDHKAIPQNTVRASYRKEESMKEITASVALERWQKTGQAPEGWEVDLDTDDEGGQPNGVGVIESSDAREWYTSLRETHHRKRAVITVTGPWEDGPSAHAAKMQKHHLQQREAEKARDEECILRQAADIQARRAKSEVGG